MTKARPVFSPCDSETRGVGLTYIATLPEYLYSSSLLDFVEITPETLCRYVESGENLSLKIVPELIDQARSTCGALPIAIHGVELSIGSAHGINQFYLDMLDNFQLLWPFMWHSEHLSFQTVALENGTIQDIGVPLPMPATKESATLVAGRASKIHNRYGVPFLLENPAHYLPDLPNDSFIRDEADLMAAVTHEANCGQLLDLHNLYCNAVNHKFDPYPILNRMPLDRVMEIHIAGGLWQDGFWTDAHSGRVPEPVWELLNYTLPRCDNLLGVVFEILEEYAVKLSPDVIVEEVSKARAAWRQIRGI